MIQSSQAGYGPAVVSAILPDVICKLLDTAPSEEDAMTRFQVETSPRWLFPTLLAVLGLVGLALIQLYPPNWMLSRAVYAFGDAAVVAATLALVVDRFAKERLLREASGDIAKYLIGYGLPEEVQGKIRELMETNLVRSDFRQEYRFVDRDRAEVSLRFRLENFGNHKEEYHQQIELAASDDPKIIELCCLSSDPDSTYKKEYEQIDVSVDNNNMQAKGPKLCIQPRRRGVSYEISARFLVTRLDHTDILAFRGPTRNVTVLFSGGSGRQFENASIATPDNTLNGMWQFNQVFMAGEHLRFNWRDDAPTGPERLQSRR